MKLTSHNQANCLPQHSEQGSHQGFTLIELLIVIIVIGVISAIALPSFLNQAHKARESEGKQYVGSMNRAQQLYFMEHQQFTSRFTNLSLGIPSTSPHYVYSIHVFSSTDTLDLASPPDESDIANFPYYRSAIANVASAQEPNLLRSYIGALDLVQSSSISTAEGNIPVSILCQSQSPGLPHANAIQIDLSAANTGNPDCSEDNGFKTLE